jgi:sphingolipid delta-4 desaturase
VTCCSVAQVREIAPEFYNDLPQCKSWPGIIVKYIFDDNISPFSRVKTASGQTKFKSN